MMIIPCRSWCDDDVINIYKCNVNLTTMILFVDLHTFMKTYRHVYKITTINGHYMTITIIIIIIIAMLLPLMCALFFFITIYSKSQIYSTHTTQELSIIIMITIQNVKVYECYACTISFVCTNIGHDLHLFILTLQSYVFFLFLWKLRYVLVANVEVLQGTPPHHPPYHHHN